MIHIFEGRSANEVWQKAFRELSEGSFASHQPGRSGATKELRPVVFTIEESLQRWVVSRQPPVNPAFAIAEVVWMLNGRRDSAFLNFWNRKLPEYAGYGEHYHGAYGFRLRNHFGLDQLERAYQVLKHNPESRQVTLQIWDARADLPEETGRPMDADIPCNLLAMLKIRDSKLEWTQVNRSNDIYLGIPYNFVQFTTIQEVLAGWLGVEVGTYTHVSDSLHLYDRDVLKVQIDPTISANPNTDSLSLSKEESERALAELGRRIEMMTHPELSRRALYTLADTAQLPTPFGNLLRVMALEAARRRGWKDFVQNISLALSNPALIQAFQRWQGRPEEITPE